MDHLFTAWRRAYVTGDRRGAECVLCAIARQDPSRDVDHFLLHRAVHHYLVLNIFPYTSGHLMIVPFLHVSRLSDLAEDALHEMGVLAARAEKVLEETYHPQGIKLGMNLGESAGAGIAGHVHLHVVPRWTSDTNFMTVIGGARVLPEDLRDTWSRLHGRI